MPRKRKTNDRQDAGIVVMAGAGVPRAFIAATVGISSETVGRRLRESVDETSDVRAAIARYAADPGILAGTTMLTLIAGMTGAGADTGMTRLQAIDRAAKLLTAGGSASASASVTVSQAPPATSLRALLEDPVADAEARARRAEDRAAYELALERRRAEAAERQAAAHAGEKPSGEEPGAGVPGDQERHAATG